MISAVLPNSRLPTVSQFQPAHLTLPENSSKPVHREPRCSSVRNLSLNGRLPPGGQLLLRNGFDIRANDLDKETAMHWTAKNGHLAAMQLLVNEKADITSKAKSGFTALHSAARFGHKPVIQLLLQKGAFIEEKDDKGCTALALAAEWGHTEVARLQSVVKRAVPQLSAHFNRRWQLSHGFVGIVWARRYRSTGVWAAYPTIIGRLALGGDSVGFRLSQSYKRAN